MTHHSYNPAIAKLDIPARILRLAVDRRGYPIPKFVEKIDGEPDFRVIKSDWVSKCRRSRLCWVCGDPLGAHLAFVIGPMCVINRVSSEPPSHRECARFSAQACPFLTHPRRRRNEEGLPEHRAVAGLALARNPGVALLYVTRAYKIVRDPNGGLLFGLAEPVSLEWFCQGRKATREEIMGSINSGLPLLRAVAEKEGAMAELDRQVKLGLALVPAV